MDPPVVSKNRYKLFEFGKSCCPSTQWVFSATGHGKNACDGVGGLVKHQAMLNSPESAIRTAGAFVTVLSEKLKGVHPIHLEEKVVAFRELKKEEWRVPAFHGAGMPGSYARQRKHLLACTWHE